MTVFQLLESTEWEELQTLELPDASQENLQLLLDVIYNGEVEATIEDLREMILLAHRLYISIPLSDELMAGLDLTLPKVSSEASGFIRLIHSQERHLCKMVSLVCSSFLRLPHLQLRRLTSTLY